MLSLHDVVNCLTGHFHWHVSHTNIASSLAIETLKYTLFYFDVTGIKL